jgi:MFS transporter, DHA2 family, multidrug resistance protein
LQAIDTAIEQLIPAQIICTLEQPLVMTPLSSFDTAGIEPKHIGSASAIYNMREIWVVRLALLH